jgi:hypothetical protein
MELVIARRPKADDPITLLHVGSADCVNGFIPVTLAVEFGRAIVMNSLFDTASGERPWWI